MCSKGAFCSQKAFREYVSDAFDIFKIKHFSLEHLRVHFRDIESDSMVRQE